MPILLRRHFSLRTLLILIGISLLIVTLGYYVLFQARHIIEGPQITLFDAPQGAIDGATTTVRGRVENIVAVSLNDRQIYTDDNGYFTETLVLPPGYTIMTLTAHDRYGRVRSLRHTYVRAAASISNHL